MTKGEERAHRLEGNDRDVDVVAQICGYLTSNPPKSFFLFAGAGSGKTRTLIEVLKRLTGLIADDVEGVRHARRIQMHGQRIGVITYTNNAANEIRGRLGDNSLVTVSTIHSFAWDLIRGFDDDIRSQLLIDCEDKLSKANLDAERRSKGPTKKDREKISRLEESLLGLRVTQKFHYNPDRQVFGEGALQHAQVINLAAELLKTKSTLAQILCDKHPVMLIDESQDTMKGILDALCHVAEDAANILSLGLLGDHRQRIFTDGHKDLPSQVPETWKKPQLQMNHRSSKRIVRLINRIWAAEIPGRTQSANGEEQYARVERPVGAVRIFIGQSNNAIEDKINQEKDCASEMVKATDDPAWEDHDEGYQILTLEHELAAHRAGFHRLALALKRVDKAGTWERGTSNDGHDVGPSRIRVLIGPVFEIFEAVRPDGSLDSFAVMEVLHRHGRLQNLAGTSPEGQQARLKELDEVAKTVAAHFREGLNPSLRDLLLSVLKHDLFDVHQELRSALGGDDVTESTEEADSTGWELVLDCSWNELCAYRQYLGDQLRYGTHQGVKGSEFSRVLVVMDDFGAGGFLFSYDKIFGALGLSSRDIQNVDEGKETTIDRTLRLLYVTCSRAKDSLALVYWSNDPDKALVALRRLNWFEDDEIGLIKNS